ncbi:hypothetical protein CEXT_128661 [Caerostris extrusa]|uniref:Uncharacterized protein n=1 Tax=Caerostris extrusa TaxID=172846 RepID=A0AAV4V5D1_CAEEX|nr:hypothetical protein CEXT_128661 [Caerostris extrusa]
MTQEHLIAGNNSGNQLKKYRNPRILHNIPSKLTNQLIFYSSGYLNEAAHTLSKRFPHIYISTRYSRTLNLYKSLLQLTEEPPQPIPSNAARKPANQPAYLFLHGHKNQKASSSRVTYNQPFDQRRGRNPAPFL